MAASIEATGIEAAETLAADIVAADKLVAGTVAAEEVVGTMAAGTEVEQNLDLAVCKQEEGNGDHDEILSDSS